MVPPCGKVWVKLGQFFHILFVGVWERGEFFSFGTKYNCLGLGSLRSLISGPSREGEETLTPTGYGPFGSR